MFITAGAVGRYRDDVCIVLVAVCYRLPYPQLSVRHCLGGVDGRRRCCLARQLYLYGHRYHRTIQRMYWSAPWAKFGFWVWG